MSADLLDTVAYMTGILLSPLFVLPTGAVTVCTMTLLAAIMGARIDRRNKRT